jgi:hypothetical protein
MRTLTVSLLSAAFLCAALSAVPFFVHAHSLGASFEVLEGEHLIDIGYEPDVFREGRYTRFDFELRRASDKEFVPHDEIWVRILREKQTVLATGIRRQDIGPTTLLFTFEEAGEYRLEASYRSNGRNIATTSIPLTIEEQEESFLSEYGASLIFLLIGLLVGISSILLWRRYVS